MRKSLSIEDTYPVDLPDLVACQKALAALFESLLNRYEQARIKSTDIARRHGREPQNMSPKTLFLKMRFSDFFTTTAQQAGTELDLSAYRKLCERAYARGSRPVRLLGLGLMFDVND